MVYLKGLLFWRCFSQYLGGMGIVVLMVAVLPFLGVGGQLLLKNELSGLSHDKLKPRVAQIAKTLWLVYLTFTFALFGLYALGGDNFFDALCMTFSTLSTGGFANWNNSIGHYNGYYVPIVTIVFMYLGSISFAIHYQVITGNPRSFFLNPEVIFFTAMILISTLVIAATLVVANVYRGPGESVFQALFQVVAIISTTGYSTTDLGTWPTFAVAVMFLLFFFGGCSGLPVVASNAYAGLSSLKASTACSAAISTPEVSFRYASTIRLSQKTS
jgi:trk system potassium uptake protein TrkH